jgi:opacity protein-like surface antigen
MKSLFVCLSIAVVLVMSGCGSASDPQTETEAVAAAEGWLALVDGGQYAESWEEAAAFFKGAVKREQWVQAMQSVRKPFGKNLSRELKSKRYRTALPGAPDGEYVIIQFRASFENKKSAIETITPMRDDDGQWRVSGYYMK